MLRRLAIATTAFLLFAAPSFGQEVKLNKEKSKIDFLGKRLFRFVLFDAVDFFAKVAGAFTAEGVLHALGEAIIL